MEMMTLPVTEYWVTCRAVERRGNLGHTKLLAFAQATTGEAR